MAIIRQVLGLFGEARRRRVFRLASLYVLGAWAIIQVGDLAFEAWGFGPQVLRYLFVGAILGFPIALIFAWKYDVTAAGIVRTAPSASVDADDLALKRSDYIILTLLLAAATFTVWTVVEQTLSRQAPADRPAVRANVPENSIAVLPFRNLGMPADKAYLGDGLAYELTSYLSKVPGLLVTANSSSFALKDQALDVREVGDRLRVRYVVEGGLRADGERLRIDVRLVDAQTGFNVWEETLDRDIQNLLQLQSDVADNVVRNMRTALGGTGVRPPPVDGSKNPQAYDNYLLGRYELSGMNERTSAGDWVERAIAYFEAAIEADPAFTQAHVALAQAHLTMLWTFRADEFEASLGAARQALTQAITLDPGLDAAYVVLARLHSLQRDTSAEETALRRALELNPENPEALATLGRNLWARGELADAQALIRSAIARDPLNGTTIRLNADLEAKLGNYDESKRQLLELFRDHPEQAPFRQLASLETDFGHYDEAARWFHQMYQREPDDMFSQVWMMRLAFELGDLERTNDWLQELADAPPLLRVPAGSLYLFVSDRPEEAAAFVENSVASLPEIPEGQPASPQHVFLTNFSAFFHSLLGAHERALDTFAEVSEQHGQSGGLDTRIQMNATMAWSAGQAGRRAMFERLLETVDRDISAIRALGPTRYPPYLYSIAIRHAAAGDREQALEAIETAVDAGWRGLHQFVVHPAFLQYEDDARMRRQQARIEEEIARQRQRATGNGWLVGPPDS